MKAIISAILGIGLLAVLVGVAGAASFSQANIPTFTIQSVIPDVSVTIQTENFPPSQTFTVTMGKSGTQGINGIEVGSTYSGSGGSITATYSIPATLKGEAIIAIRLQSTQGYFSYNWFANASTTPAATTLPTTVQATTIPGTPVPSTGFQNPTFEITNVIPGQQVTIQTANFPANQVFKVSMGKIGTLGVNGIQVDQTDSGSGGSFSATYSIPADLAGQNLIAIRLQSAEGYFSYNWFNNAAATPAPTATSTPSPTTATQASNEGAAVSPTAAGGATATPSPAANVPTFTILSVVQDESVTIQTANFPANQTFNVLMGKMGTAGVGGTSAGQTDSGKGGTLQATYTIPSSLKGMEQIAIRLESSQGFFAYNWFWNLTTP